MSARPSAKELFDLLDAGLIERYMLSAEELAQVEAYEAGLDAMVETQIAAAEAQP